MTTTPLRRAIERRSAPVLVTLRGVPKWVLFLAVLALALGGLFAPAPVGAALLAVLAIIIGWLSYLAWPVLAPPERVIRAAVPLIVLVAAVVRVVSG